MIVSLIIPWMPALTLLLAMTIQELALPIQAWTVFRPDIVLVGLFYWRLYRPDRCTIQLAFAMGILIDIISGVPLGLNAFSKTLMIILVGRYSQRLRTMDFIHLLPAILMIALLDKGVQLLLMGLLQGFHVRWSLLLGQPMATVLVAPLCFSLLIYVHYWWLENVS